MSGHSKWKTIKHKKDATDQKRGKAFSKLLAAVAIAAKGEPNPDFNPRLRTAVQKAKEANVPQDNIERAIKKSSEQKELEELTAEAYGPESVAMIITMISDNRNRTIPEVKKILSDYNAKWATEGSVKWSFEMKDGEWQAKFKQDVSDDGKEKLQEIIEALEDHDDVQDVYTNAN